MGDACYSFVIDTHLIFQLSKNSVPTWFNLFEWFSPSSLQSWHAYYLISDHFSTQLSGTEEFLTKILMKVLPGNRNRNMVQGSCFYFISQRENGEENQKGKVTYLGLLNMNWFSWYYQWVWLVAFKWYLEKCNLHLTCEDTWTTCSRMHGSFILRSAGFRIRHLILAWVLSGAIPIHPWYPHLSIWT